FLAQPAGLPERMLAADPDAFIDAALARMAGGLERIEPRALAAYRAAFRDPEVRHAICEDYRAAVEEDLEHDAADRAAGRRIDCPVLVLWGEKERKTGAPSPVEIWSRWAATVSGHGLPAGHLLPEDAPQPVLAALAALLGESA
ncbi:alpha/beta fold hydrolase, partial [Burkholderia gladioli]